MTSAPLRLVQVDVFAERPLSGNAAAVVFGAEHLPDETLHAIARETNLSETVFLLPPREGGDYRARIFTTRREIAFAVHPTLAAAHAFAEATGRRGETLVQECGAGLVPVGPEEGAPGVVETCLFARVPTSRFAAADLESAEIAACLGIEVTDLDGRRAAIAATGVPWILVGLARAEMLARLDLDHRAIARASRRVGAVGMTVFARDPAPGVHARMRTFAPGEGIWEDPGCGSCAGSLAALLLREEPHLADETLLVFEQGAEIGRPGRLLVRPREGAFAVGGACISVLAGHLEIGD